MVVFKTFKCREVILKSQQVGTSRNSRGCAYCILIFKQTLLQDCAFYKGVVVDSCPNIIIHVVIHDQCGTVYYQ